MKKRRRGRGRALRECGRGRRLLRSLLWSEVMQPPGLSNQQLFQEYPQTSPLSLLPQRTLCRGRQNSHRRRDIAANGSPNDHINVASHCTPPHILWRQISKSLVSETKRKRIIILKSSSLNIDLGPVGSAASHCAPTPLQDFNLALARLQSSSGIIWCKCSIRC